MAIRQWLCSRLQSDMKLTKISGKMMAFYFLWKRHQDDKDAYIPIWQFVGELHIPELKTWVMASHKCTARVSDMYLENPDLLDRNLVKGKSGAEYFEYKFTNNVTRNLIKDLKLRLFYDSLVTGRRHMKLLAYSDLG